MRGRLLLAAASAVFVGSVIVSGRPHEGPLAASPWLWAHVAAASLLLGALAVARDSERPGLILPLRIAAGALAGLVLTTLAVAGLDADASPDPMLVRSSIFALPEALVMAGVAATWSSPGTAARWTAMAAWVLGITALALLGTCFGAAVAVVAGAAGAGLAALLLARAGVHRDRRTVGLALIATGGGALSLAVLLLVANRPIVC